MEYELTAFNIGLVSMGLFLAKMLLMLFLGFDDEGDFESDGIYAIFSINKILSFFMGFGFAQHELNSYYISIPVGIAFAIFYHFIMKKVRKMSDSVDVETVYPSQDMLVKTYNRVTCNSGVIMWNGREFDAISNAGVEFPPNELVKVKNVIGSTVYVEGLQTT